MLNLWVAATGTVEGLSSMGDRTQNYIVARKLLLDSADAVEHIMLAQKQISELDGYVTRVTDMLVRVYPPLSICARHVRSCVPCVLCVSCVPCAVCCVPCRSFGLGKKKDVFEDMHDGKFVKTMINNVDDDDDGAKRIKGGPDGQDSDDDDAEEESTIVKEKRVRHHDNGVLLVLPRADVPPRPADSFV